MAFVLGLGAPGIASAHDGATGQGHEEQDSVVMKDAATERRLADGTVAASRTDAKAAAAAVVGNEGEVGQWGPVMDWPVVGIHVALLTNGKVLAWDASALDDKSYTTTSDHTFTRATVFDPATGTHTPQGRGVPGSVWVEGHNIFCAGFAHLTDGTLFAAGGNLDVFSNGIVQTYTFNSASNAWTRGVDMRWARWYPSVTPLTNGGQLITGGRPWIPEVRQTDGSIRALSEQTGAMDVPFYPWMDVAPDGRVFYSGPDDNLRKLDPAGGGTWQNFGARGDGENREYGSHALYDVGKILVAGGGPSSKTTRAIDMNGATPQVSMTSPMAFGRRQFNLTTLADGTVLSTGGNSTGTHYIDMNGGVYQADSGTRQPAIGRRSPRSRSRASTTRAPCCWPTAACCRRGAGSAMTVTGPARPTWGRMRRSSLRRTCSRRTAPASSRRVPRSARRRPPSRTAPRSRSRPRMRPPSRRWG